MSFVGFFYLRVSNNTETGNADFGGSAGFIVHSVSEIVLIGVDGEAQSL